MSKRRPELVAEEDQVVAVLRDAGEALTEREIRERLGAHLSFLRRAPGQMDPDHPLHGRGDHWHECRSDGCFRAGGQPAATSVRRLARAGLVERSKDGHSVRWLWVGPRVDMSEFEALIRA